MFHLFVRIFGLLMFLGPFIFLVHSVYSSFSSSQSRFGGSQESIYLGLLLVAIFSFPGAYIAWWGPLTGEEAKWNRKGSVFTILIGLGMMVVGFVATVFVSYIGSLLGFAAVFYGMIGLGVVQSVLGLASCLSGRNLVEEMSNIKIGK